MQRNTNIGGLRMIYYCHRCDMHFSDDETKEVKPDGGVFHKNCMTDDFIKLSDVEILEELNIKKR